MKSLLRLLRWLSEIVLEKASTLTDLEKPLVQDGDAADVDEHLYRSMIGSLMYLTASRPDIMFAVYACARFQVSPKTSHLLAVKRIFRYLKGKPSLGLWYSKDSLLELVAYTDSDYAGATQDRKSTTRGCQFLGNRLISWQCKKQTVVATFTTEAEYVAAASCCGQNFVISTMAKFLGKSTGSEGFHQVIDFLSQSHISYALTKKPEIYISFIKQFWRTAEAYTDADGRYSSLLCIDEYHVPTPNESPLHAVQSHGSVEGSLKLNELTNLVTKLSERIRVLDDDLKKTKQTYSFAFTKLILRIKKLEFKVKTRKARQRARVVLSEDEEDDSFKQGRKLSDIDEEPNTYFDQDDEVDVEVVQDQDTAEEG
ncbi:hypothetical protein Tco_1082643 [Tanacetum coccineum]|uniref:Uncharacterized protein n=1 Tax=Tanacetum coccineum TaxID=301880 RepID=A0ABQ5I112_9ASTR